MQKYSVITSYECDRAGNRTAIVDANSNRRTFDYDAADRQIASYDALNQVTRWEYDKGGRVLFQRDPRGSDFDLAYSYDELNRTTGLTSLQLTAPISTTYNALGWRTSLQDATGTTNFAHDAIGRVITVDAPSSGAVGYAYDARGLRTSVTYPNATTIGYSYLPDGQLHTVSSASPANCSRAAMCTSGHGGMRRGRGRCMAGMRLRASQRCRIANTTSSMATRIR
jgi:YD repeat-containing protein